MLCLFTLPSPHPLLLCPNNRSEKQLFAAAGTLLPKAVPGWGPLSSLAASYALAAVTRAGVRGDFISAHHIPGEQLLCQRCSRVCHSNALLISHALCQPHIVCRRRSETFFFSLPPPPTTAHKFPIATTDSFLHHTRFLLGQGGVRCLVRYRDGSSLTGKHTHGQKWSHRHYGSLEQKGPEVLME